MKIYKSLPFRSMCVFQLKWVSSFKTLVQYSIQFKFKNQHDELYVNDSIYLCRVYYECPFMCNTLCNEVYLILIYIYV